MNIACFDDLLLAARQQAEPQRLLLVFAGASLGADATPQERAAFEAGHGGELTPLFCVDKDPEALLDFASLCSEAAALAQPWVLVFAAALGGRLDAARVDAALKRLVDDLRAGRVQGLIPFDREGRAVRLG